MILKYFNDIFSDDKSYRLLWTLSGKKSFWFQNNSKMVDFIKSNPNDIFYGLGVADKKPEKNAHKHRLTIEEITSIKIIHLDIDIKDKFAHKKQNLPDSTDKAREIANKFLTPTWLISSGHGLHANFVLDKPFIIKTKEDRDYITALIQAFQDAHRQAYPEYEIDFTHDLARVLRCPGSINCKDPENKVPCEIIEHTEEVYWLSEFEDAIDFDFEETQKVKADNTPVKKDSYSVSGSQPVSTKTWTTRDYQKWFDDNGLVIDQGVKFDNDTWLELDSFDPRFTKVFHHKIEKLDRNGKPTGQMKEDINGYDLDLANIAARMNLPDQQIVDLLVYHRVHHGTNIEKAHHKRRDYYARTLLKAGINKTLNNIKNKKNKGKKVTQHDRAALLSCLSDQLECDILRLIRYNKDPNPVFEMELADKPGRTVKLGTFDSGIMNQRMFRSKVAAVLGSLPRNQKQWEADIIPKLMDIVEDGEVPVTSTYEGQVETWVTDYFGTTEIFDSFLDFIDHGNNDQPFMHKNKIHFKLETLQDWIGNNKSHKIDFSFVTTMISTGFTQQRLTNDKGIPLQLWAAPENFYKESEKNTKKDTKTAA